MINIPYEQIIDKIKQSSGLSDDQINEKIDSKMDQLSGLISKEGAAHIIANELGIKLFETSGKLQIKNVLSGMRNVEVVGKVIRVYEVREFSTENRQGKVGSFLIGDETGIIRIVCWNAQADNLQKLSEGTIVKISSGYVRENNNRKEIHLNDNSKLDINPEGESVQVNTESARKKISELSETDDNVELLGTVVQAFDLRFFEICPQCAKRIRLNEGSFTCQEHGAVEPDYSYVMNIFLDDGTENIRTVFFRNQTQNLLSMTNEQILNFRENEEFEQVKHNLLGQIIKVTGRTSKNEMFDRLEFVANRVDPKPDPNDEIKQMEKNNPQQAQSTQEGEQTQQSQSESQNIQSQTAQAQPSEQPKTNVPTEDLDDLDTENII